MAKNEKILTLVVVGALVLIAALFIWRDVHLRSQVIVHCGEGDHPTIDMRDFTTQYSSYSVKLEATVASKGKASLEFDPKSFDSLSEALKEANEFRKYVVAGYNACAITPAQYATFGERFRRLDGLGREIDSLLSKTSLSEDEKKSIAVLIRQYGELAKQPAT
jgi:hypothetical protein